VAATRKLKRSAIKRLKASYRKDSHLLGALQRHVMRLASQPDPDRRSDVMHPSDMSKPDWCPRRDYWRIIGTPEEKVSQANPSFTMENILTEGTNIHRKYQGWLWDMGVLFGMWACEKCGHHWEAVSPFFCPKCEAVAPDIGYREVPLLDEVMMVGGHSDGAVHDLLRGLNPLIEIKSIGIRTLAFEAPRLYEQYVNGMSAEDIWFSIKRPFGTHLKQGMLYCWLSKGRYDTIIFIYESKFTQQVKEFLVKFNPTIIAGVLDSAKEVSQGVRAGIPPDHPTWAAPDGPICQSCTFRRTCWDLKENHAEDDSKESIKVVRTIGRKRKAALGKANGRVP
jgi:CRISPR/Cas system-associated exonuclease Cas4 (RecB family)